EQLEDLLRILIGHQPAGDLEVRLTGRHRLGAGAGEAAPKAIEVQRRPAPVELDGAVAVLADDLGRADTLKVFLLVERRLREELALLVGDRDDVVIEALDGDPVLLVMERRRELGGGADSVLDRRAEAS